MGQGIETVQLKEGDRVEVETRLGDRVIARVQAIVKESEYPVLVNYPKAQLVARDIHSSWEWIRVERVWDYA
jgi:hypothetical protein